MTEHHSKETRKEKEMGKSELEKYWQVVRDNPADFPGWTYLLHYVEQENNIEAAREAFSSFFARYPYCYGYWKKYADMERLLTSPEAAEKVFEDGVKAIPLSVDLWVHYLNFYKAYYKDREECYEKVKQLFRRALDAAGKEFRSDRLWDTCVTWEEDNKKLKEITDAYDMVLSIPTQLYSHHYEKFCKHVKNNSPRDILSVDEFLELRKEVVTTDSVTAAHDVDDDDDKPPGEKGDGDALPPGVDSLEDVPPGIEAPDKKEKDMMTEEQVEEMRKKIIEKRKALYAKNELEVGKRWTYEEGIKRPYFHVKALEKVQLNNWKDYLDFEIANSTHERVVILFERCMIACALYEDMWLKYAKYMEEKAFDEAENIYQRACQIHLPKKPLIHFSWATYEELRGNSDKTIEILQNLGKNMPDFIEIMFRQVNVERRRGNTEKVGEMYTTLISEAKKPAVASSLSKKFARYLYKVNGDFTKAKEILKEALIQDPMNPTLYLQLADMAFQSPPVDVKAFCEAMDLALESEMGDDVKLAFSRRKLEFIEDFGQDAKSCQKAYEEHVKRLKSYNVVRKRALEEKESEDIVKKKAKTEVNGVPSPSVTDTNTTSSVTATTTSTASSQDTSSYYNQSPWMGYQQNSYNYHQSWNPYNSSYYSSAH